MRRWLAVAATVVPVMAALTGCKYGPASFACTDDHSCGLGGKCEPGVNLCSFLNEGKCGPGGRAYGDIAGDQSGECVNAQPAIDAAIIDVPPDAPRTCFGTNLLGNLNICLQAPPTGARTISATSMINTDDVNMCTAVMSGGTGLCVVAAATITVDATWRATGVLPLVLIARDSININAAGTVDVASRRNVPPDQEIGAGGDPASCQPGTGPANANNTNGGGAGGSFAGIGGTGGNGGGTIGQPGGAGGTPAAIINPINQLRGGCPGQDGKGGGAAGGKQGHGGGAILLIAGQSISIAGKIHASGEGGRGGVSGEAGGGGGGAGGMIILEAPTIMATGLILANGGAGGEGSGTMAGQSSGNVGADPATTAAARGGNGGTNSGGDGGDGSAGATAAGSPGLNGSGANSGGGGGGGGGAGFIKASPGASLGTQVSPPAT